jgi:signal transduction histidine kinase
MQSQARAALGETSQSVDAEREDGAEGGGGAAGSSRRRLLLTVQRLTPLFERVSWHPIRLLAVGVALTLTLFVLLAWSLASSYGPGSTVLRDSRVQRLAARMLHLDEALGMSARLAAATGDLTWHERYRAIEPKLQAVIAQALRIAPPDSPVWHGVAETQAARAALLDLEGRALGALEGGDRAAAAAILLGGEYERQKEAYTRSVEKIATAVDNSIDREDVLRQRRVFLVGFTAVVSLAILLTTWLVVLVLLRWHLIRRKRAERELRQAHGELEIRVRDRTAHLAAANRELEEEVAERKRIEGQLAERTGQLKRLARHQIHIEEELRRHIARELHDELGQSLTALLIDVQRQAAHGPHRKQWNSVVDELQRMIRLVREISYGLRPPELEAIGLARSLESLASSVDRVNGTAVRVEAVLSGRLSEASELCLYRVAQEALSNAVQHGKPSRVDISLRAVGDSVVLRISDNGAGFDEILVRQSQLDGRNRGLGLLGMRERVAELGGTLTIDTAPGGGTRIEARLPTSAEPAAAPEARGET